jgi:hypothetical protein
MPVWIVSTRLRAFVLSALSAVLGGCTPGSGCSCGPDLPGEFEECTEDLRCAEGLQCFTGGGECDGDPAFFSFCARPCAGDQDCGGLPQSCEIPRWRLPDGFCRLACDDPTICEFPLPTTTWHCGGGYCFLCGSTVVDSTCACVSVDAGLGSIDGGT